MTLAWQCRCGRSVKPRLRPVRPPRAGSADRAARLGRNCGRILGIGSHMLISCVPGETFTSTTAFRRALSNHRAAVFNGERCTMARERQDAASRAFLMCFEPKGLVRLIPRAKGGPEQASRLCCRRRPGSFRSSWSIIDPRRCRFGRSHVRPEGSGRNYSSGLRIVLGFKLAGEVESQLAEPPAQGLAGNP
jgi:hypothetical protein